MSCFKNIQDDDIWWYLCINFTNISQQVGIKMAATFGRKIGTVMAFESNFETDNISAKNIMMESK